MEHLILDFNDKSFRAEFDKDDFSKIVLNGKPVHVELLKKYSNNIFSFSVDHKLLQVEFDIEIEGKLGINFNGFSYEIEISDDTKKILKEFIKASGAGADEGIALLKAPMPGMVIKHLVSEGDIVKKGDKIIIVEAMKMENALGSPANGSIRRIIVPEGEAVNKDAVLVEIDAE